MAFSLRNVGSWQLPRPLVVISEVELFSLAEYRLLFDPSLKCHHFPWVHPQNGRLHELTCCLTSLCWNFTGIGADKAFCCTLLPGTERRCQYRAVWDAQEFGEIHPVAMFVAWSLTLLGSTFTKRKSVDSYLASPWHKKDMSISERNILFFPKFYPVYMTFKHHGI